MTVPPLAKGRRVMGAPAGERAEREDRDRPPGPATLHPAPCALQEEALTQLLAAAPRRPRDAPSPDRAPPLPPGRPGLPGAAGPSCFTVHNCVETPFT